MGETFQTVSDMYSPVFLWMKMKSSNYVLGERTA